MNYPQHKSQKPIIQSTFEDYEQVQKRILRSGMLGQEVMAFLDIDELSIVKEAATFPPYDLPQIHRGIERCFPDWQLVKATGHGWHRDFWAPEYVEFDTGSDNYECFLSEGVMFFRAKDGSKRIVLIETRPPRDEFLGIRLIMIGRLADRNLLRSENCKLKRWIRQSDHYLRNRAIRPSGQLLNLKNPISLDDVALLPEVRSAIEDNVIGFFQLRERFQQLGLPQSRGIILHGAPGNGKTMIGKALAASGIATFVQASPADLQNIGIRETFAMARRLGPAILFLEDVDFIAGDSHRHYGSPLLGELLVQLDGIEENDGMVVISTTNNLEALDPAIKERPSRFDVLLEIKSPQAAQRKSITTKYVANLMSASVIESIVARTEGFSGAQTKEFCIRLAQKALEMSRGNPGKTISDADMRKALSTMPIHDETRIVGFASCGAMDTALDEL